MAQIGGRLVVGLIGDPVEHSLSPHMHNAAFEALGIEARYELWPTAAADLGARVESLRRLGTLGANVTVPHKQVAIPLLDVISDTARRIGAVNTIVPRDGELHGDNTDAFGFGRSLAEVLAGRVVSRALVVGAGGASRAVLASLQEAGFGEIVLVNRTQGKANTLARSLDGSERTAIQVNPWNALAELAHSVSVLVNATSIGWHGEDLPFDLEVIAALPDDAVVFDLTYRSTALLRAASKRGLKAVDGLPMLVYQGARSFELWTGRKAPVDSMRQAVLAEQARRV